MKKLSTPILLLMSFLAFSGCSSEADQAKAPESQIQTSTDLSVKQSNPSKYPVTVSHGMGELTLDQKPE
ncbi:MAG: hypothetical protein VYB80_02380, partial [Actinomycetota bacterium]|nr:hypothetical protein [Actinomycetota bacterium]